MTCHYDSPHVPGLGKQIAKACLFPGLLALLLLLWLVGWAIALWSLAK